MSLNSFFRTAYAAILVGALAGFCLACTSTASLADDAGTLKLKVNRCPNTGWISGARVDVVVTRVNVGQIDSAAAYTDGKGYVEFTFTNLQGGDQATVTVTPSGESSDPNHWYRWVSGGGRSTGIWDLDINYDAPCADSWSDQTNDIILCEYHTN